MDLGSKLTFPQRITSLYFEHFLQATLLWALPSARSAVSVTSRIQYVRGSTNQCWTRGSYDSILEEGGMIIAVALIDIERESSAVSCRRFPFGML